MSLSQYSRCIYISVAPAIEAKINHALKSFHQYLPEFCNDSFFISPCTKEEILDIISMFNNNKVTRTNSIPLKIIKLVKNSIPGHLSDIYNTSFSSGIFPEKLKIAKVTPIFKKGSKLQCSNYRPISLVSNLDKI